MTVTPATAPSASQIAIPTTESSPAGPAPTLHRGLILVIVLVGYFMVILDNSVVFTGVPSIRRQLALDAAALSWVQDAYTLVFGGFLLLAARAGDLLGRRRLFIVGLIIFTAASLLVGAATSGWWIIAARALQGIGAAIVAPTSLALLTATFTDAKERGRAVSAYAAVAGIGASLGLVAGGALTQWVSWRAGFLVNLPIGIAMIVLALRAIPSVTTQRGRFDVFGAVLATLGVGSITLGVVESSTAGWASLRVIAPVVVGIALVTLLVRHEARAEQPIMPLSIFGDRARSGAYLIRFCYMAAMIGFFFFTTQLMQDALGFTPLQAGLGFLPITVVNFAVALLVGRVIRLLGRGWTLAAGIALTLAGMVWLAQANDGQAYLLAVAAPMLLVGAGQGLAFAPLTSLGLNDVRPGEAGAASGVLNTVHQLGSCLGLAALTSVSTAAITTADAFRSALLGSSIILGVALVATVLLILPAVRARV